MGLSASLQGAVLGLYGPSGTPLNVTLTVLVQFTGQ